MPEKPAYVLHHVDEKDATVDWFFGDGPWTSKLGQLVLVVVGWFFAILPIVITASAIIHRDDSGGWWNYQEGFDMWEVTMKTLGFLLVFFIVAFLAMYLLNRRLERRQADERTYDEQRLARRLELAGELYTTKYGPASSRKEQRKVRIAPYGDFETYELRDHYRNHGVG